MIREEQEAAIAYINGYRKLDEDLHNTAPKDSVAYYATDKCLKYWDMAIQALEKANIYDDGEHYVTISKALYDRLNVDTCTDTVSRGVFEQVMRERDIAIEQLHELGYELGQKIEPLEVEAAKLQKAYNKGFEACRQAVLDEIDDTNRRGGFGCKLSYTRCRGHIEQLPSATQKSGMWIRVTDKAGHLVWECDKCGWQQRYNTNFCPDCGAKMESEQNE